MKTEDLIDRLAADLKPAPSGVVPRALARAGLFGAGAAFVLVLLGLGLRPDLAHAAGSGFFWVKTAYTAVLGAAGWLAVDRLARPAGSPRRGTILALSAFVILLAPALAQLALAPPAARMPMWLGASWTVCPFLILGLAVPTLAASLWLMRRLAPTRLTLAGAAAGLFSGGVAATVYGLHCPESTAAFVVTWYSLGIGLATALGALLGPRALRW